MDSGEEFGQTEEQRALKARYLEMREEHRALDETIAGMDGAVVDHLQLARLKKRKLALKDEMRWIENQLTPDIIA